MLDKGLQRSIIIDERRIKLIVKYYIKGEKDEQEERIRRCSSYEIFS